MWRSVRKWRAPQVVCQEKPFEENVWSDVWGGFPGASISVSKLLGLCSTPNVVSIPEASFLRKIPKNGERKISEMYGHQSVGKMQKILIACDYLEINRRHLRRNAALNLCTISLVNSCSFHLRVKSFLFKGPSLPLLQPRESEEPSLDPCAVLVLCDCGPITLPLWVFSSCAWPYSVWLPQLFRTGSSYGLVQCLAQWGPEVEALRWIKHSTLCRTDSPSSDVNIQEQNSTHAALVLWSTYKTDRMAVRMIKKLWMLRRDTWISCIKNHRTIKLVRTMEKTSKII